MTDIIFERVIIKNFGCFLEEHELDLLKTGLIYVTGRNDVDPDLTSNGIGKTSAFNAILWCLYGRTFRSARPGDTVNSWLSQSTVSVDLFFRRDSSAYHVRRSRRPNELSVNGNIVIQSEIDKLIGMSFESISNTIIIGQFNNMFLSLRPEQQSTLFSELLNLDFWNDKADNAVKSANIKQKELSSLEIDISKLEGRVLELERQLVQICTLYDNWQNTRDTKLVELQSAVTAAAVSLECVLRGAVSAVGLRNCEASVEDAENKLRVLAARRTRLDGLRKEFNINLVRIESVINQLKKEEEAYENADDRCPACGQRVKEEHIAEKINCLHEQIDRGIEKYDSTLDELNNIEEELKAVVLDLENTEVSVRDLRLKTNALQLEYAEFTSARRDALSAIDRTKKELFDFEHETNPYLEPKKDNENQKIAVLNNLSSATATKLLLEREIFRYKFWADAFKQIRLNLIDETLTELEIFTNRIGERLGLSGWQIRFDIERETAKGETRARFTTLLYPPNQEEPIPYECFSGGELQRWNLACVFSLSEILLARAGIYCNLRVLDEPTRNLSEAGVDGLLNYLHELSAEQNLNIFFLDHHSYDSGYFNHTLFLTKDTNGSRFEWK